MSLLSFLNPLNAITDSIVKWQIAKETAKNDTERIEADVKIKELETRRDLQVAAAINDKWWSPRTLIGWMVATLLFKLIIWDTVLGLGVTANPGSLIKDTIAIVIAFYFGGEAVRSIGNSIAVAVARRK